MNHIEVLEQVRKQTEKLIHLHRLSGEENSRLKAENLALRKQLAESQQQVGAGSTDGSSDEMKQKIDEMVREIDKCLEKLNS